MARRILLADDSVTAQNMGRRILTDAGYEVITVNNGSAALKKIQELKPDLIVVDVYMPGYGGLEVCQRVKETTRIPVLLTVGKLEPFKPDEARRVKADGFIVKPFEATELLSALSKLEDKIVPQPQPQKPGRFAKTLAALDQADKANGEQFGDRETGWKNRLIIPTGAHKSEEPQAQEVPEPAMHTPEARPEPVEQKTVQEARETVVEPVKEFERPLPAGIPADITADEIAAISAAAASVGSPAAESENARGQAGIEVFAPESVEATPSITAKESMEPAHVEAQAAITEEAVATVLAQAAAEVSEAEPEQTALSGKDSDVMAAIASLAPAVQPESAASREAALTGPRWLAKSAEVTAEEAALDLHAEMAAAHRTATAETSAGPTDAVATMAVAETAVAQPASSGEPAVLAESAYAPAIEKVESQITEAQITQTQITEPQVTQTQVDENQAAETQTREGAFAAAAGAGAQEVASAVSAPAPVEAIPEMPPKDSELAAAWQNWKQIRNSIVGSNLTEQIAEVAAAEIRTGAQSAQESEQASEQESAVDQSSEPDAIASIVDSVLAELKPKLIEEIARKMNAERKASRKN